MYPATGDLTSVSLPGSVTNQPFSVIVSWTVRLVTVSLANSMAACCSAETVTIPDCSDTGLFVASPSGPRCVGRQPARTAVSTTYVHMANVQHGYLVIKLAFGLRLPSPRERA
jgi:hypothetical protein